MDSKSAGRLNRLANLRIGRLRGGITGFVLVIVGHPTNGHFMARWQRGSTQFWLGGCSRNASHRIEAGQAQGDQAEDGCKALGWFLAPALQ